MRITGGSGSEETQDPPRLSQEAGDAKDADGAADAADWHAVA